MYLHKANWAECTLKIEKEQDKEEKGRKRERERGEREKSSIWWQVMMILRLPYKPAF